MSLLAATFLAIWSLQLSATIALYWTGRGQRVGWRAMVLVLGGECLTVGAVLALIFPTGFLVVQAAVAVALAALAVCVEAQLRPRALRPLGWGQLALTVVGVAVGAFALDRSELASAHAAIEGWTLMKLEQVRTDQQTWHSVTGRYGTLKELQDAHGTGVLPGGYASFLEATEVRAPDESHWAVGITSDCDGCRSFLADQDGGIRVAVGRPATAEDALMTPEEASRVRLGVMSGGLGVLSGW